MCCERLLFHAMQAEVAAATADEKASAAKSLGAVHMRLAYMHSTLGARTRALCAAAGHFATAMTLGTPCKGADWCADHEREIFLC